MILKTNAYQVKSAELKKMIREEISKMSDVGNSTQLETLTELTYGAFSQGMGNRARYPYFDVGEIKSDDYVVSARPSNGTFSIYKKLK